MFVTRKIRNTPHKVPAHIGIFKRAVDLRGFNKQTICADIDNIYFADYVAVILCAKTVAVR